MDRWLVLLVTLPSVFLSMMIIFLASGPQWKAEEDKARARRLADAKMNARLLRFNI